MKRDIVLRLHRKHVEEKHKATEHRHECPMCERAYLEAYHYWTEKLEETLLPLIKNHELLWNLDGVMVGNASSPGLDILHEILTNWIDLPLVEVTDTPETYWDHPLVQEIYERELAKK